MFATAATSQVKLDKIDEATSIFGDSVVPAYKQMKGFKNAFLFIDPTSGRSLGISIWATEAASVAVQSSGALQEQMAKFASVLAASPAPGTYEVKVLV